MVRLKQHRNLLFRWHDDAVQNITGIEEFGEEFEQALITRTDCPQLGCKENH